MAIPNNELQAVQTYQTSLLAALSNQNCFMDPRVSNMRFKNFNKMTAQLGDTVNFDEPFRYVTYDGLVATFQATTQRVRSLQVNKAKNTSIAMSAQEFIFNLENYMDRMAMGAMAELGAVIEADIASGIIDGAYRFYGDGTTPLTSFTQLATAQAYFRNFSNALSAPVGIIDDISEPAIIGSGLTQFAPTRNNDIANSWEIGKVAEFTWFRSNFLPIHNAGAAGVAGTPLTFVSINSTGTQITFSGAGTVTDLVKAGDLFSFPQDNGTDSALNYLTFTGHMPSQNFVQVRVTSDADSSAGTVVVDIYPALIVDPTNSECNLTRALTTNDIATVLPSHRAGLIMSGSPLFVAMPMLPTTSPFISASANDPDTGVSVRVQHGELFGQNTRGVIHDVIWGKTYVPEYCMRLIIPL